VVCFIYMHWPQMSIFLAVLWGIVSPVSNGIRGISALHYFYFFGTFKPF
jgi:hypothetical protein